ncbi:NAD-dependent epimerase/dehydratase family protein [Anaerobacillus sp. MEB173]|uniref:NAD-dependent epimerase/dehydratase family protein n=1 Tax=Anaerobacillus sp. MEB173 TaxID=3383345 RepID=UPI003F939FBB
MNILVTGAAGFIGSHLCERLLLDEEIHVIGVDGMINTSLAKLKKRNVQNLLLHPRFQLIERNLFDIDWDQQLENIDVIYHLAGMPGVRTSWGKDFSQYVRHNILATQQLLEACRNHRIQKFIYASTSSVYGDKTGKVSEDSTPEPLSPYGVTKLTGEHLCHVYHTNDNLPIVIVRFFTVYGPRQRQDMAFHRFIRAMIEEQPIPIFGDGKQTRDFTYISDCVEATARVLYAKDVIGESINIGGKERSSVLSIVTSLEEIFEKKAILDFTGGTRGEPKHTWADISKAQKLLNYNPLISLREGLQKEVNDLKQLY